MAHSTNFSTSRQLVYHIALSIVLSDSLTVILNISRTSRPRLSYHGTQLAKYRSEPMSMLRIAA